MVYLQEMTSTVVEQLRSRPFEDISDEICAHNEEGDIVRSDIHPHSSFVQISITIEILQNRLSTSCS